MGSDSELAMGFVSNLHFCGCVKLGGWTIWFLNCFVSTSKQSVAMFSFQTFHLHKSGRENNEKTFYKKSTNFFFSFIRVEKKNNLLIRSL